MMAASLTDLIDQVDVNSPIANPGGCVVVDPLVVPREAA